MDIIIEADDGVSVPSFFCCDESVMSSHEELKVEAFRQRSFYWFRVIFYWPGFQEERRI